MAGRPKHWTLDLIQEYKEKILHEISVNGYALVRVCKLEGFPSKQVVLSWLREDIEFQTQYARACEERADKIFDELIEICDSTSDDIILDEEGKEVTNHNVINRDKLRIDTRKWILAKMNPKKYGDKIDLTNKGEKFENVSTLVLPDAMKKD